MTNWLKRYFVPSEQNGYAPHILQKMAVLMMGLLIALTFALSNVYTLLWQASDWMIATVLPGVIIDLTNDERIDQGSSTLARNPTLDEAARLKAEHMANNSYFAHYAPDGTSPWYWFDSVGYPYAHAGENLAIHFSESTAVVDAWMRSPTHRQNIVDSKFQEIGVGTARGMYNGFETVYVVQLFGTPRAGVSIPAPIPAVTETEPASSVLAGSTSAPEPTPSTAPAPVESVAGNSEAQAESEEAFETTPDQEVETAEIMAVETTPFEPEETLAQADTAVIAEEEVNINMRSDTSGTITTSTGALPATIALDGGQQNPRPQASALDRVLTAPSVALEIVYAVLAFLVVVSLIMSIIIEWRRQHPVQIAYGLLLLVAMGGLYQVHQMLVFGAVIL